MAILPLILTCATLAIVYLINLAINQYAYWKRRQILHLECMPIIGILAPVYSKKVAFPKHAENLYKHHGDALYFGTFDFNTPIIILKDPKLISEIAIKNFDNFPNHRSFVTEEMDPVVGRNVFSLKDDRWKEVRNTLTPCFTANKMKILFHLVNECSKQFALYFKEHKELAEGFDAKDIFTRYTNDVIATSAFGIQVNSMRDRENDFYKFSKDATVFHTTGRLFKFMIFRSFPKLMRAMGEQFLSKETSRFFKQLISKTVRVREEQGIVRSDMIHILMQAKAKEDGIELTIDDIIGQAFIFLLAGFDTVSTCACYLAYELAANQSVQEKVYQEVISLTEKSEDLAYESLGKMKYFEMAMNESLRLCPPTPMTDRVCTKEFLLPPCKEGYPSCKVQVGTNIWFPIYGLHRDPKYFPEPEKFIPERFQDENNIDPNVYMPFGIGPRKCIGMRFAIMEIKALFVHLLRSYRIELAHETKYPSDFCTGSFNMEIEGGYWIKLVERKKSN